MSIEPAAAKPDSGPIDFEHQVTNQQSGMRTLRTFLRVPCEGTTIVTTLICVTTSAIHIRMSTLFYSFLMIPGLFYFIDNVYICVYY